MNKTEQKRAAKGKAFNKLKRIFHPKGGWKPTFCLYDDISASEQRDYEAKRLRSK